jgi:hypothetical protein
MFACSRNTNTMLEVDGDDGHVRNCSQHPSRFCHMAVTAVTAVSALSGFAVWLLLLLLQAENVLALVNARTAAAADSALAGLQGGLGQLVSELRRDVLSIITELEARLDFDEDLPPLDVEQLKQDIAGESGCDRLQYRT